MDGRPNRRNKAAFSNSSGVEFSRVLFRKALDDSIVFLTVFKFKRLDVFFKKLIFKNLMYFCLNMYLILNILIILIC